VYYEPQDCFNYHCLDSTGHANSYAKHFSEYDVITTKFSSPGSFKSCFAEFDISDEYNPKHLQYIRGGGDFGDTECGSCNRYARSINATYLYDDVMGGYGDDPRGVFNIIPA
jgi:hypothetical protein